VCGKCGVCELCEEVSCLLVCGGGQWYLGRMSCVPTHQFFCGGNDKGTCQRTQEA